MKIQKLQSVLPFLLLLFPLIIQAQSKLELDVATIMQEPKTWVGSFPNRPFWSEDSRLIYFYWNPEAADADSLYKISVDGGQPIKLSLPERLRVPPPQGVYSRDYRFKLFIRNGDLFLYDKKQDTILQITNTTERETRARFSQDEKAIIFQKGMNLFRWDRNSGITTQITGGQNQLGNGHLST